MAAIEIRDYVRDYDGDSEFLGFTCNTDYDYNIVGYEHRMEYDVPEPVEEDSLAQSAIQVWIYQ